MPNHPSPMILPPGCAERFGAPPPRPGGFLRRLAVRSLIAAVFGGLVAAAQFFAVAAVPGAVAGWLWLAPAAANDALPDAAGGFDPGVWLRWGGGMASAAVETATGAGE